MKKSFLLGLGAFICLTFIVSVSAQNQKSNKTTTGCGSDVPLVVFNDQSKRIISDRIDGANNSVPYVNGGSKGDKITAIFQVGNCSHDFTLNLNFSSRFLVVRMPDDATVFQSKFFNFDRIHSVPLTPQATAADAEKSAFMNSPFCREGYDPAPNGFVVRLNSDGKTYWDNYGGCGIDEKGGFVRRSVGFDLGDGRGLRFQHSPVDNPNNTNTIGTSYVRVYHPDVNTWELVPEKQFVQNPDGTLTEKGEVAVFLVNQVPSGNPVMPFGILVRRQFPL